MEAPVDMVMSILHFEGFEKDYEAAYNGLNKGADS